MLTINDVARIFNVPPATIQQWCEQGKIKDYPDETKSDPVFRHEDVAVAYLDKSIQENLER